MDASFTDRGGSRDVLSRSGHSTVSTSPIDIRSSLRFPIGPDNKQSPASSPTPEQGLSNTVSRSSARRRQFNDGPPTSGNSTPLREPILESPTGDSFPDFQQPSHLPQQPIGTVGSVPGAPQPTALGSLASLQLRRRAGTLPSRLPGALASKLSAPALRSTRPSVTPPAQPEHSHPPSSGSRLAHSSSASGVPPSLQGIATPQPQQPLASVLGAWPARFRSDSLPSNRLMLSAFGHANQPERGSPLANLVVTEEDSHFHQPSSLSNSRQALLDGGVRTLDYLGLMDASLVMAASDHDFPPAPVGQSEATVTSVPAATAVANRFRSYSVNAGERYVEPIPAGFTPSLPPVGSNGIADGSLSIQEAINQHNRDVEAFLRIKSSLARPRSKTTAAAFGHPPFHHDPSSAGQTESSSPAEHPTAGVSPDLPAIGSLNLNGSAEAVGDSPTRAIWLGNIPSSTTISSLNVIFGRFGTIESSRVLTHKNCGFVNFDTVDSAVRARAQLNGKEIFPGAGPTRIGFAKAPSRSNTPAIRTTPTLSDPEIQPAAQPDVERPVREPEPSIASLKAPSLPEISADVLSIVIALGATAEEQATIVASVESALANNNFCTDIPSVPEPHPDRVHDAPRLRDIRKRIDNHSYLQSDIEGIAMGMLPEIAELSSDYLGNTVVQKLFEHCSDTVREAMLTKISPHLAGIGIHKNGTWAAQKIIDVARSDALMKMVADALRPYSVALFLDQFGNYVVQGCLRYVSPLNDFIFEAMVSNLWDLAQGRFGARAMRACLESHYATKSQQMMVAAAIAIHSVRLATNTNGALLLTWFLDTCTLDNRRVVLAPRLIPHLIELCTHKVAYLTVLKLINQRSEPEARSSVLNALFFSSNLAVLENILSDPHCGPTFIFKVLTSPFLEDEMRPEVVQNVRSVLQRIKAQPHQGYKRLMDEVGLSTRHASNQNNARETKSAHVSDCDKADDAAGPHRLNQTRPPTTHMPPGLGNYMPDGPVTIPSQEMPVQTAFPPFPRAVDTGMYAMAGPAQLQYQQAMQTANRNGFYSPVGMPGFSPSVGILDPHRAGAVAMGHGMTSSPIPHPGYQAYPAGAPPVFPYAVSYISQTPPTDPARRGMGYQ